MRLINSKEPRISKSFFKFAKSKTKKLKENLTLLYYAYKDPRLPLLPKLLVGTAILYALSPIDLIPDFIPVLGHLDDLIILPALISLAIKLIPKEIMQEARQKALKPEQN